MSPGSPDGRSCRPVGAVGRAISRSVARCGSHLFSDTSDPSSSAGLVWVWTPGGASNDFAGHLVVRPYAGQPEGDGDAYVDPQVFHELFCAELPSATAAVMAVSQRPITLQCFGTPSGPAGWKTIPSWYMVASQDRAIPPVAERAMAARAGSHTVEVDSSHVAFISHPQETVDLIVAAVQGS